MERGPWCFECKLCRARFRTFSYTWPCDPLTPQHNTIDETTCRWRWCIGSGCAGRVLGPQETQGSEPPGADPAEPRSVLNGDQPIPVPEELCPEASRFVGTGSAQSRCAGAANKRRFPKRTNSAFAMCASRIFKTRREASAQPAKAPTVPHNVAGAAPAPGRGHRQRPPKPS